VEEKARRGKRITGQELLKNYHHGFGIAYIAFTASQFGISRRAAGNAVPLPP